MNVTYLFGAGASAEAITTTEKFPERLNKFLTCLKKYLLTASGMITLGNMKRLESQIPRIIKDTEWLIENIKYATSIDTLAKRLYIQKSPEYRKIKALMIVFFMFEHFRDEKRKNDPQYANYENNNIAVRDIDPRYDNFFASIIQKDITELPNNIKILSWNYDMQFEMAFNEYSKKENFEQDQIFLQVFPSGEVRNFDKNKFGVVKLNGSLQSRSSEDEIKPLLCIDRTIEIASLIKTIFSEYEILMRMDRIHPFLFFSWENNEINVRIKKIALEIAEDTECLVVIGYSFPYFNRYLDKEIIGKMGKLRKVYFQAPKVDLENYFIRFNMIRPDIGSEKTMTWPDLKQFFIPPELS